VTQRVLAGGWARDRRCFSLGFAGLAALGALFALCGIVRAEESVAPNTAGMSATAVAHPANPHPQPGMRGVDPGILDSVGRWIDWSMEDFNTRMKAAHGQFVAFGEAGRRATDSSPKEFTDSLPKMPSARVIAGRERCEIAANGAPDCNTAVEAMCRTGGFSTGRSLDVQAVQKCPARIWLSGRVPQLGECQTEAFVNRALCQ
jgi:stage V sporulation protein SpoVS